MDVETLCTTDDCPSTLVDPGDQVFQTLVDVIEKHFKDDGSFPEYDDVSHDAPHSDLSERR